MLKVLLMISLTSNNTVCSSSNDCKNKKQQQKKKQVIAKNRRPAPSPESASAHCTSFIKNVNPHTCYLFVYTSRIRSSLPQVFSGKDVLKICSKFTGEQPCQSVISKQLN